jgi:hypothetical protein
MGVSFAQLRSEIATNVGVLAGFNLAKMAPAYFGRQQNTVAHKSYVVGVDSTTATTERQRRVVGVYASTNVVVSFAHRLRPLDVYPTDYDQTLDVEQTVINAVLGTYSTNNAFTIRYNGTTRSVVDSQEYMIVQLQFTALHTIQP